MHQSLDDVIAAVFLRLPDKQCASLVNCDVSLTVAPAVDFDPHRNPRCGQGLITTRCCCYSLKQSAVISVLVGTLHGAGCFLGVTATSLKSFLFLNLPKSKLDHAPI